MMKLIAIPTRDGMVLCRAKRQSRADNHFGHCAYYTVVTLDEQNQVIKQERLDSPEGCDHHDCDHHQEKLCANRAPSSSLEMAEVQPKVFKPVYFVPSFGK